ncbi:MAG: hypothetical protein ACLGIT_00345 [Gammaproteobacteria bacterium]|uniref:hypothetical protein n=1 Tax=Azohydromonas sp. TaxID=1872666 RepID=UPI002BF09740|nr:hypothetical protein [Azohydromonas sp.]HMM85624.1 hypothetical protein [Azohydromonas sp.]
MNTRHALLGCALLMALDAAAQSTIYRCGDGRVFSQAPCTDGRALVVDARTDSAAASAALDVARREAALAARLTQERRSREAEAYVLRRAAGLHTAPRPRDDDEPRRTSRRGKAPKAG